MDFIIALRERKTMAKNRQRPPQAKMATNNPPGNHSDEEVQGATRLSEILKEIREFCTETAGNFATLTKYISELKVSVGDLKIRMDEAESRIAQNEDHDINLTKVIIHNLRKQTIRSKMGRS